MAEDSAMDDTPRNTDDSASEDESDSEPVETLIAGRERRKTAGNRYDRDMILEEIADEEDADEVTLLFADNEDEEDEEFKSSEPDEDADMSSDEDDDQGPNAAGVDDLEEERELQKLAKAERAKKRKADLAFTTVAALKKRPKIDTLQAPTPSKDVKPSKRKERVTWLPEHDGASSRTSLRKQTIAHREITIARLKLSEAQSAKLKALKEKRERERARYAPKALTQADRLAEAERVERRNAKSLNRWEATEKKRAEEQAAKLAALKNRKLEGPVITFWSGMGKWVGPRLNKIGSKDAGGILEGGTEVKKRGRKPKAYHEQMAATKSAEAGAVPGEQTGRGGGVHPESSGDAVQHVRNDGQADTEMENPQPKIASANAYATMPAETDSSGKGPSAPSGSVGTTEAHATPATTSTGNQPALMSTPQAVPLGGVNPPEMTAEKAPSQNVPDLNPNERPQSQVDRPVEQEQPTSNAVENPQSQVTQPVEQRKLQEQPTQVTESVEPEEQPTLNAVEYPPSRITQEQQQQEQQEQQQEQQEQQQHKQQEQSASDAVEKPQSQITQPVEQEKQQTSNPVKNTPNEPVELHNEPTSIPVIIPPSQKIHLVKPHKEPPSTVQNPPSHVTHPAEQQEQPASHTVENPPSQAIQLLEQQEEQPASEPAPSPVVENSTRNLIILDKFEEVPDEIRQEYSVFYNNRKTAKPAKRISELCPITTLPVRYRDPATGIGYANSLAYKKLQELKDHKFIWSSMLGCYVGRAGGVVARGVPEGFLGT